MSASNVQRNESKTIESCLEIQIEAHELANMDVFSLSDPFAVLAQHKAGTWEEIGKFF